jgi:hypothetical protein
MHNIRINLGSVDYSLLNTDSAYEALANKILPKALVQIGEAAAETTWNETQKAFGKSKAIKLNTSLSDKRKFIRDGGQNYKRSVSFNDKQKIKAEIVAQLKGQKSNRS